MKRIILLLLTFALLLSFSACQSTTSGVGILALEEQFQKGDASLSFPLTEAKGGYTFSYENAGVSYEGSTDAKRNVTSVTVVSTDVNTKLYPTASALESDVYRYILSPDSLGEENVKMIKCVYHIVYLCTAFRYEGDTEAMLTAVCEMMIKGITVKVNGFSITPTLNATAGTVTVTAVYGE